MLKGHTRNIPLTNILQTLVLNQQGGILSVQFQKMERHLAVRQAGITLLTEHPYSSILLQQTVARLGLLSASEYQNVIETAGSPAPPGTLLLERHLITPEQVMTSIAEQLRESVYEIFEWRNASYSFDILDITDQRRLFADPEVGRMLELPVNGVLMEVARREDEWSRIRQVIPHPHRIYRMQDPEAAEDRELAIKLNLTPDRLREVVNLVSAELTVAEILDRSSIPPFFVFSALRSFLDDEHATTLSTEDKKQLAERARQQFQTQRMESIYLSILEDSPDERETRKKLLIHLERKKAAPDEILPHMHYLAASAESAGNSAEARQLFERILKLDAHDLHALECVTRLDLAASPDQDCGRLLAPYAKIVRSSREYQRGADFLLQICALLPKDGRPRQEAANLYLLAGNTEEACKHYEESVRLFMAQKRYAQVRKALTNYGACDESAADRWRRELNLATGGKPDRRVGLRFGAAAAILTVITGLAFVTYEWDARVSYAELLQQARTHARNGDLLAAEVLLRNFKRDHPYTLIAQDVFDDMRGLVLVPGTPGDEIGLPASSTSGPTSPPPRTSVKPIPRGTPADVSTEITRATVLKNQGDYLAALQLYRSLDLALVPDLLARTVRIETQYLSDYLVAAEQLASLAKKAREEGRLAECRNHLKSILKSYSHSPAASQVRLPVMVRVLPIDARVTLEGRPLSGPDYVIDVHPEVFPTLRVERSGFLLKELIVDPRLDGQLDVLLQRQPAWVFALDAPAEARPLLVNGQLFVGVRNGKVISVSVSGHRKLWEYPLEGIGDPLGSLHPYGNDLVFAGTDGAIYRLSQATGELVARIPFPGDSGLCRVPLSKPGASGITVAVTSRSRAVAFSLNTGQVLWDRPVLGGCDLPPVCTDTLVLLATRQGRVLALDATTGEERWSRSVASPVAADLAITAGKVLVATEDSGVQAIDLKGGEPLWKTLISAPARGTPALADGRVAYATGTGAIVLLDLSDGKQAWSSDGACGPSPRVVVTSSYLVAIGEQGRLGTHRLSDGTLLWSYDSASSLASAPYQEAGMVAFSSGDRRVHLLAIEGENGAQR